MASPIEQTRAWYERYAESVHRRCLRILGEEAIALDVTHEVFIRAHKSQFGLRSHDSVLNWLLR